MKVNIKVISSFRFQWSLYGKNHLELSNLSYDSDNHCYTCSFDSH